MRELQVYSKAIQNRLAVPIGCILLFLINAAIASRLFHLEYANHMGSVEGAYISLANYFAHHGYSLTWFPLWYGGEPLHNTYPPGLMWLAEWTVRLTGWSAARSYHFVTGAEYCLGPVTGFLLAAALSGRLLASFAGGVLYSIVNVSAILVREVRADVGGRWLSRRMQVLEPYGEGPHILTLVLLPLAILFIHRALTQRRPLDYCVAAFALAAVLLSNVMGALAILLGTYAYLVTRDDLQIGDWIRTAALGVVAYAIVSMWIPPSMATVISERARFVGGDFTQAYQMAPVVFPLLFITATALAYFLRRWNAESAVSFFAVAFFLFAVLALPAYWRNISFVPMPKRYHVELDLLFPFALTLGLARLPWKTFPALVPYAVTAMFALATVFQVTQLRRQTERICAPIDIAKASEFKIAKQLESYNSKARVFVPGSAEVWLGAFGEIPEFGGGFVQAIPNQNTNVGTYLIESSDGGLPNPPDCVLWLQAFGVARVVTTGPGSTEVYKPFQNPDKFKGLLKEIWHQGGDAIYEVPLHSEKLAHVLPREALVRTTPINGIDVKEVARYVDALSHESKLTEIRWDSPSLARIHANLTPKDAISVQVSYVDGWNAHIGGAAVPVEPDGLGLIRILPSRTGEVDLTLEYTGGLEAGVTKAISLTAIFGTLVAGIVLEWTRRRGHYPHAHRH